MLPNNMKGALRMTGRLWLLSGAVALGWGILASGCAPQMPAPVTRQAAQTPEAAYQAARLESALQLWKQEGGPDGDDFSAGRAAFEIASIRHDPQWARRAIDRSDTARKAMPEVAQANAWFGASHAIMARDYPVQGLWQALPGPGFARIYHVKRAETALNNAVETDPDDPVARLIRAASISAMPDILVRRETADEDFAQLSAWADDPSLNPAHAEVLAAAEWRQDFFRNHAVALEASGATVPALAEWRRLSDETVDPVTKEYAQWNIARLSQ